MPTETFTERFRRLTAPLRDAELAMTLDLSMAGIRKLREGETQSLKFDAAIRLCRRLGISPWELAGEEETDARVSPLLVPHQQSLEDRVDALAELPTIVGDLSAQVANALSELQSMHTLLRSRGIE